jgi:hypothetical protein
VHHRNSDPNNFSHGPPTTSSGPKLTDVREQLGEERRMAPITPIVQGSFFEILFYFLFYI